MPLPRCKHEGCEPFIDTGYRNYTDDRLPVDKSSFVPDSLCYPLCILFTYDEKSLASFGINYSLRNNITKSLANDRLPEGFDSIESINEFLKTLILAKDPNYIFESPPRTSLES